MDEELFYKNIQAKSVELGINPLLLLSGIEGLFTFKDVQLNSSNYDLLDSLILSILALRIGDQFHAIAEENLTSQNPELINAAAAELKPLSINEIDTSENDYLKSFAQILNGKTAVRRYHLKALDAAALEIKKLQLSYNNENVSLIMLDILKNDKSLELDNLFG